jgi:hypothetical protein
MVPSIGTFVTRLTLFRGVNGCCYVRSKLLTELGKSGATERLFWGAWSGHSRFASRSLQRQGQMCHRRLSAFNAA